MPSSVTIDCQIALSLWASISALTMTPRWCAAIRALAKSGPGCALLIEYMATRTVCPQLALLIDSMIGPMTFIWAAGSSGSLKRGPGLEVNVRDSQLSGALAFLTAACAGVSGSTATTSAVINVIVRFMGGLSRGLLMMKSRVAARGPQGCRGSDQEGGGLKRNDKETPTTSRWLTMYQLVTSENFKRLQAVPNRDIALTPEMSEGSAIGN